MNNVQIILKDKDDLIQSYGIWKDLYIGRVVSVD